MNAKLVKHVIAGVEYTYPEPLKSVEGLTEAFYGGGTPLDVTHVDLANFSSFGLKIALKEGRLHSTREGCFAFTEALSAFLAVRAE